jgi:RNA polymerase sigma-70 factor (ECF subfamily)
MVRNAALFGEPFFSGGVAHATITIKGEGWQPSMAREAEQLIEEARAGNAAILGQLLESYRSYLRLLAQIEIGRRLQGKVDPSDVVQEVFLDAHRYFPSFRGQAEAQFTAWLREILAGTLANLLRRYIRTQARDIRLERTLADDLDRSSQALGRIPVDPGSSPSTRAIRSEQTVLVAEALCRLPNDYREVIVLRHLEGLTFPAIAERMGRSLDSVEKLWMRGLKRLRQEFGAGL